jgi:predicted metal-binding protein
MDGGYGSTGKDTLRRVLRDALRVKSRRRDVRIIETRCMGICPKRAVTALNASHPGRILMIPKGTATDEAMAQLMREPEQ